MSIDINYFYFSYGSNMDELQMKERCENSMKLGSSILQGYEFLINSRGVATISKNPLKSVIGILWEISEDDLKSLDKYEGVSYNIYTRTTVQVIWKDKQVSSIVYLSLNSQRGQPREGYLEKIVQAAVKNSFPENYIQELESCQMHQ